MPKLQVHTKFTLRADDGSTRDYPVGQYDFTDEQAGHWYVKLHAGTPTDDSASALTESDTFALSELEAELKAEAERLAALAAALDKREEELGARLLELDGRQADLDKREADLVAAAEEFEKVKVAAAEAAKASAVQAKGAEPKQGNSKK